MRSALTTIALATALTLTTWASDFPPDGASCEELLASVHLTGMVHANMAQLRNYPGIWAGVSTQIMMSLRMHFLEYPQMDFAYFEQLFRRDDVPLYLVANSQPPPTGYFLGLPQGLRRPTDPPRYRYYLWVGVNGPEEASALKKQLGLTEEENLRRLKETGVILAPDIKNN